MIIKPKKTQKKQRDTYVLAMRNQFGKCKLEPTGTKPPCAISLTTATSKYFVSMTKLAAQWDAATTPSASREQQQPRQQPEATLLAGAGNDTLAPSLLPPFLADDALDPSLPFIAPTAPPPVMASPSGLAMAPPVTPAPVGSRPRAPPRVVSSARRSATQSTARRRVPRLRGRTGGLFSQQ
eukprot:TRINITY_DN1082_c0_g1_i11.p3 TRINITY_DN1082_c0_g1~~TRINITY_DN1082_c0_g1_i11.p3  ORF type:complete len:181 (-),score=31.26 TRINITY_DN1082_c0_g1_i11:41-583(-)